MTLNAWCIKAIAKCAGAFAYCGLKGCAECSTRVCTILCVHAISKSSLQVDPPEGTQQLFLEASQETRTQEDPQAIHQGATQKAKGFPRCPPKAPKEDP